MPTSKLVAAAAGELAKRAKGGDGLAMDYASRMQRAKEQGFDTDTVYYHGTGRKFDSFDPQADGEFSSRDTRGVVTFTDDYSQAERYSKESAEAEKVWDDEINRYIGEGEPRVVEAYLPKNMKTVDSEGKSHDAYWMIDEQNKAKQEGYDGIIFDGMRDDTFYNPMGLATNTTQVFDPSNIRSVNAAFDPAKKDSSNLLASMGAGFVPVGGAMGIGGYGLLSPEQAMAAEKYNVRLNDTISPNEPITGGIANLIDSADKATAGSPANLLVPTGIGGFMRNVSTGKDNTGLDYLMATMDVLP